MNESLWFVGGILAGCMACFLWRGRRPKSDTADPQPLGRLELSKEDLERLEQESLFVDLLLLGRISNSLRFAHTAPLEVYDEGTPRAARQLNGAFFVQVAFAVEALDTLKKLTAHLKDYDVWRREIVPLFRDPEVQELEKDSVRDLRRKLVFHFEREAIEEGIGRTRQKDWVLAAMGGRRRMDTYFPLADEVAVAFLVPTRGLDDEGYRSEVLPWLGRATDLSLRIAEAVETVAVDFAKQLGLQGVWSQA